MKASLLTASSLPFFMFFTTGCGAGAFGVYPFGTLFNSTQIPHSSERLQLAGAARTGDKEGEACTISIMSLVGWGDASTDAAKKAGSITDIHSMEFKNFSILGVYNKGCTVIHGK
jgi:hypothetical protein